MAIHREKSTDLLDVEERHLVLWNGRTQPQAVTEANDKSFEVKSRRGSYYRFDRRDQSLINKQSGTKYKVSEFSIVGEVYDLTDW